MADYRIVCTEQTRCPREGHITAVGTGTDTGQAEGRFTVREVYTLMDLGHTFHTHAAGRRATVRRWDCPCGAGTLRSTSDAIAANNLDNLRICDWRG